MSRRKQSNPKPLKIVDRSPTPPTVMFNQPIYVAISMNPLILVPVSLNAENPGFNNYSMVNPSAIISANGESNCLIPDLSSLYSQVLEKTALFTGNRLEAHRSSTRSSASSATNLLVNNLNKNGSNSNTDGNNSGSSEQPLDLSFHKNSPSVEKRAPIKLEKGNQEVNGSVTPNSINHLACGLVNTFTSPVVPIGHITDVLVKQGTYRCEDCKIVFCQEENYLVHKSIYCSTRRKDLIAHSPENGESSIASGDIVLETKPRKTPRMSPGRSSATSSPPPVANSPPQNQPVVQYFCVPCGIRYSSMDNLQAHQTYYCPKKNVLNGTNSSTEKASFIISMPGNTAEVSCAKCKAAFCSHEALLAHVCSAALTSITTPTPKPNSTGNNSQCFKCAICGYKGHTLRGMRTHVRIHQDKIQGVPEESFIITADEAAVVTRLVQGSKRKRRRSAESSYASQKILNENNNINNSINVTNGNNISSNHRVGTNSHSELSSEEDAASISEAETTRSEGCNKDQSKQDYNCKLCNYTSTYKGNLSRHIRLVHNKTSPVSMSASASSGPTSGTHLNCMDQKDVTEVGEENSQMSSVSELVESEQEMALDLQKPTNNCTANPASSMGSPTSSSVCSVSVAGSSPPLNIPQMKKSGTKYCRSCDIPFKYLASFVAHKKYYCSSHSNETAALQVIAENKSP